MDASLTVGDMIGIGTLGTHLVAGAGGLDRRVVWAHSCELEEPWKWIAPDELLLTVGFCVPTDAAEQVRFVRELDRAGVSAASIGQRAADLRLSDEMLAEADRLGFPILRTEPEVPWSALTRHVAAASNSSRTSEVLTLAKLYELASVTARPQEILDGIAELLHADVAVLDSESGRPMLRSIAAGSPGVETRAVARRIRRYSLAAHRGLDLELGEHPARPLGAMVLVHVKRLVEVEADRVLLRLASQVGAWGRAIDAMLAGRDPGEPFAALGRGELRAIVCDERLIERLGWAVGLGGLSVLVGAHDGSGIVLVPESDLARLREILVGLDADAGASKPFRGWRDARGAITEATSALADARGAGGWVEFEAVPVGILARSGRESREIVREVLGPLAGRERRAAELRRTLFAYLRNDRRWAESAAELSIHRQTLSYRLRGIQAATGRSLSRSEDIAALWIAMQAWEQLADESDPEV